MTPGGLVAARYDAYSIEMAESLAARDGYEVLDIMEGNDEEGFILVIADEGDEKS